MISGLLLLDIETVPCAASFTELDSAWQSLFCEKITKTMPEEVGPEESYRKKAGILAEFGKIICISTAFFLENDRGEVSLKMKSLSGDDEVKILMDFTDLCNRMMRHNPQFQFCGHNIKEFDIPFICRRILINRLPLPEYLQLHDKKPWQVKMFDTLNWWKFGDNKNYVSLHLLANVLGIPTSKSDIDGSMVQDVYYRDKDLARIVAYCQRDVVVTANVVLRFNDLPLIPEENITIVP